MSRKTVKDRESYVIRRCEVFKSDERRILEDNRVGRVEWRNIIAKTKTHSGL